MHTVRGAAPYDVVIGHGLDDQITPMLHGDKPLVGAVPAARDSVGTRLLALALLAVCAGVVYAVVQLGNRPMLG